MTAVLKLAFLLVVVFVLLMLAESLGVPVIAKPGYLVVRSFTPLPEPYPISSSTAPHRLAITVVNASLWASVLGAWFVILRARTIR